MLSVVDALELIAQTVASASIETVSLEESLGTVLAADVISSVDSPPFDKSMMDGFAVRLGDLKVGETELVIAGELLAGQDAAGQCLESGQAIRIMTGAPIPGGTEAVIPVELSSLINEKTVQLTLDDVPAPGRNVIRQGTNMRSGELLCQSGQRMRPQEMALFAEIGQSQVDVRKAPTVSILATGDELVPIDQTPGPGQIRDSNALMLAAQVRATGAHAVPLEIARDNRDDLKAKIQQGLESDLLLLSGGVSAGKLDLVPSELEAAGVEQVFHKVAMKPGKPIWFGCRNRGDEPSKYVFGLPGNPVSSMVCFELFVRTAIRKFMGIASPVPPIIQAKLTDAFKQRGDREVWFPSRLFFDGGQAFVTPVDWKGSSDLRSTIDANSSLCVPGGDHHYQPDSTMNVLRWSE